MSQTAHRSGKTTISPARAAAFEVLRAVECGGYASDLLIARTRGMDPRDAGLASEIVFGTLRFRAQLDYLMARWSARPAERLDAAVRVALRMGIYQLRYLERVPPHAAVGEAVEMVKRARKHSAAGFVNAVLRKVDREPVAWPGRAVELSHPAWMLERWAARYGMPAAEAIARADLRPPETYVRVPAGTAPPPAAQATEIPGCYRVPVAPPGLRTQDIGSQAIVPLLQLAPGHSFLDLCAAPGNKTAQALETATVRAVACDLHPHRAATLKDTGAHVLVLDGTQPLPFSHRFDRILLDAPCSGTGTLARNPEIKWRLKPANLAALQAVQIALLRQARAALVPGGILVYSTCSLEHEENEDVVATQPPGEVVQIMQRIPGRDAGDGFFAAVIKSG